MRKAQTCPSELHRFWLTLSVKESQPLQIKRDLTATKGAGYHAVVTDPLRATPEGFKGKAEPD